MTTCQIKRRENEKGKPFSEILIEHEGRHYCSHVWWILDDDGHARAAQIQDFHRRQARPFSPLTSDLP